VSRRKKVPGIKLDPDDWMVRPFLKFAGAMRSYHDHEVLHLERLRKLIRERRRVVLVGNHALDMLDPLLFVSVLLEKCGCVPCFVGHENLVFGLPGLREVALRHGMIPSRHMAETAAALQRDGMLMLYPGSGSEAARRIYSDEPYRLKWKGRSGFLRLALEHDAELLFVAAVGIDEMYFQSRLEIPSTVLRWLSSERYRGSRLQFGPFGPHLLPAMFPFPVKITHVISPPIDLGDRQAALHDRRAMARLHRRVEKDCQDFLDRAVAARDESAPLVDRAVRAGQQLLRGIGA